jgi:DNA-binding protein H-NS
MRARLRVGDAHFVNHSGSPRVSSLEHPSKGALIFPNHAHRNIDRSSKIRVIFPMNLKSMSIDKLSELREQIDAMLGAKVMEERRAVQEQLGRLERLTANGSRISMKGSRGGVRGAVAPKYRNPDNPAETWAGRGLKPRWLAAALKSGKKIEDFSITAPVKKNRGAPKKARRK